MDNVTHGDAWPRSVHEQCEWEVAAAREDGIRHGIEIASQLYENLIAAALRKPDGHGGPDLDVEAREAVYGMFRRYFGVGVTLRTFEPAAPDWRRRLGPR